MGLLDVVRSGVKVADALTKSLQTTVTYRRYSAADHYGKKQLLASVPLRALVENKLRRVTSASGIITDSTITITLLDAAAVASVTGGVGITVNDEFVLPSGSTNPILNVGGFVDAGTGQPFATEVYLG